MVAKSWKKTPISFSEFSETIWVCDTWHWAKLHAFSWTMYLFTSSWCPYLYAFSHQHHRIVRIISKMVTKKSLLAQISFLRYTVAIMEKHFSELVLNYHEICFRKIAILDNRVIINVHGRHPLTFSLSLALFLLILLNKKYYFLLAFISFPTRPQPTHLSKY